MRLPSEMFPKSVEMLAEVRQKMYSYTDNRIEMSSGQGEIPDWR